MSQTAHRKTTGTKRKTSSAGTRSVPREAYYEDDVREERPVHHTVKHASSRRRSSGYGILVFMAVLIVVYFIIFSKVMKLLLG